MYKHGYVLTFAAAAALLTGTAMAQATGASNEATTTTSATTSASTSAPDKDGRITKGEVRRFDHFLDSHPEVAEALRKNPGLVDNEDFMEKHPGLRDFLKKHPGVRDEIKDHPERFMNREAKFEKTADDRRDDKRPDKITREQLRNFDHFLDSHPEVSEALRKNPRLIDDQQFMQNHPELQEFLKNHPGVRDEIKDHPGRFMKREAKYEKNGEPGEHHRRHRR